MNKVYFIPIKSEKSLLKRIEDIFQRSGYYKIFGENDLVGIKVHMGEKNNTGFIRPIYVRKVYEILISLKTNPYLVDTTTLYRGSRANAIDYINTARWNGFDFAPIIIADGLSGNSGVSVKINKKHYKEVKIADGIFYSNKLVCISHFKGHELSGFGGAIKNLGMGCSTKEGKLSMHSGNIPIIRNEKCTGCRKCEIICPADAIKIKGKIAMIEEKKCIGCGECIAFCHFNAIGISWDVNSIEFMEKMVEYAYGAVLNRKVIYINIIMDVTPECDCYPHSKGYIVPDIGILFSLDPVAIDQCSFDLIKSSIGIPSFFGRKIEEGRDKFSIIHPEINSLYQIEYAERIGLGKKEYEINEV